MNKYDLVIIGSGASGLSAGVSALKSGIKNVLILEMEDVLGGNLNLFIDNGFGKYYLNETVTGPELGSILIKDYKALGGLYKLNTRVLEINRDRTSPVDYFTIKLLLVIIALSLCLMGVVLSILPASPFIFIVVFLASYFLPDLFWKYLYIKRTNRIVKDVFISTKYIYYGLNKKMSIDNAINYAIHNLDGDITDELDKILKDLKHNISLEDAYYKFYKRSNIKEVLSIYQSLKMASLLNISYVDAYKYIINDNINVYEEREHIFKIVDVYNYLFLIVLLIPLLVFIFGLFINLDYFARLMAGKGLYLVILVIALYSIYIYIIKNILEVKDE